MSRGFVREDDQEEVPMVPPRASLPEGVTNYVTQTGMDELLGEKEQLLAERAQVEVASDKEKRIATNLINAKLQLLNERINSARVLAPKEQDNDTVRFGVAVTVQFEEDVQPQEYRIVGVDEADITKGKIAFISPMARALMNKRVGEEAVLKLAKGDRTLRIMSIKIS